MQGVLCLPPGQLDRSMPNKIDEMEITTETRNNLQNQSDSSGVFSATGNSTTSTLDDNRTQLSEGEHSDNRSECSTPDRKSVCPICNQILSSRHEFTVHIRLHNNDAEAPQDPEKGYTCRICSKVLSSSSSLDRHVLVHTGERPFTCKYCGDTFTTNGNMHRHMRTHKIDNNYESDGSVDSNASSGVTTSTTRGGGSGRSIEFNNNKLDYNSNNNSKRKFAENENDEDDVRDVDHEDDEDPANDEEFDNEQLDHRRKRPHLEACFKCPVCNRSDFASRRSLEVHVEDNHPDYPAKCHQCNQIFNNQKRLNYHKMTVHADDSVNGKPNNKQVVIGFKDLDYVDFSSDKFPTIARNECELVFHRAQPATGPKYVCDKCSRAFPCDKSLEIHARECGTPLEQQQQQQRLLDIRRVAESIKRDEFFHRLDLEDNNAEKLARNAARLPALLEDSLKMDCTKDLADIQSIISLTNGSFLQQLHGSKSSDMSTSLEQEKTEEEESQDQFAQEFRKMKLRGEFPCRLCSSVFPNLRALKGHNRTHLNSATNGTYRCNMCPYFSLDKAALIRHMRTHNGDRPYECSLCNYAFTTKANCERHLRNRHSKNTREEVKKSIIYHPSEDPTNDEMSRSLDSKKLNTSTDSTAGLSDSGGGRSSTPKNVPPAFPDLFPLSTKMSSVNELILNENLKALATETPARENDWRDTQFATSTPHKATPNIRVKDVSALKEIPEASSFSDNEESVPMDLSKKPSRETPEQDAAQGFAKGPEVGQFPMDILSQQLLKTSPTADPALSAFFAAQMAFFRSGMPNIFPGFAINPLLMPPIMPDAAMTQEMKERIQRQLSNSSALKSMMYAPATAYPTALFSDIKANATGPECKAEEMKPLSLNVDVNYNDGNNYNMQMKGSASPVLSTKTNELQSPNSVKMVIKNGVLMPKQKQRRYRTERPFSCEHCAARFTLRSNMERHIKQQHPQFWSQRQRSSGMSTPGRKPLLQTAQQPTKNNALPMCELSIPMYEAKSQNGDDNKTVVSEKLRYAILAQHLRSAASQDAQQPESDTIKIKKEEIAQDEDGDSLVIDEEDQEPEKEIERERTLDHPKTRILEEKLKELRERQLSKENYKKSDEVPDLVPVSRLLNNASQPLNEFREYFRPDQDDHEGASEEDEEGLVASGSTSDGNSGTDENRSENDNAANPPEKKKSAYSLAPNRVSCPYCSRKFPWTSSLRRHVLTHTGQKPFKCSHCPLLFTTKSNCDRHLLRKHGNSATTISNETSSNNNFMLRNVPERPFKCANCPSSTFSTYSNLKKHMFAKHGVQDDRQGYEAGSSEDEKNNSDSAISNNKSSDWEAPIMKMLPIPSDSNQNALASNSDLPFKCHLCDSSFGDRQECLEHIRDKHVSEYEVLMNKNALDPNASTPDEGNQHDDDDGETIRGKFPDYSNRKVICAFCMRRFWSAEDLRRHMRTHTGERPFSCDICRRRFTLKHSMLRHRKKHNVSIFPRPCDPESNHSDEENEQKPLVIRDDENERVRLVEKEKEDSSDANESGGDLISNLLGIRDRSLIDQVLTSSADDAAKLLGVGANNE